MKTHVILLCILLGSQFSPAEIEGVIRVGYDSGPGCFSIHNSGGGEHTMKSLGMPIIVTVCDEQKKPIVGAYAALKRLAPDDYKASDLMTPETARTDSKGIAVVMHPRLWTAHYVNPKLVDVVAPPPPVPPLPLKEITLQIPEGLSEKSDVSIPKNAPAPPTIQAVPDGEPLRGCITVIAEGYETKAVELGEACGENGIEIGEHTTLRYTIVLTRKDAGKAVGNPPEAAEKK